MKRLRELVKLFYKKFPSGGFLHIVLDDGKINGVGTNEQLIKNNEIYRDIVMMQKKGGNLGE